MNEKARGGIKLEAKFLVLFSILVACVLNALYASFVKQVTVVYTHFFYIPILLAGLWYRRREALAVALFLGIVHILITYISPFPLTVDEFARAAIFVLVAYVVGYVSEQKAKQESAVREREEKYGAFFKTSRDPVFITSTDGGWLDFNDAMVELLGYESRDELFEVRIPDLYENPEDPGRLTELLNQEGFKKEFPVNLRRKDGSIINAFITSAVRKDENGRVLDYQGTIRDVTAWKKAEEKVRESEEKFRSIVENSSDQIFMLDKDYKFLSINKTAADLSKKSPQEMVGTSIFEIFPEETGVPFSKNIKNVFDTGESMLIEEKMLVQGREFYNSTSLNPVKDDKGSVIAVTGIVRDITDRKRTEDLLRTSEAQLSNAMEIAKLGYWEYDVAKDLFTFNDHFYAIFRTSAEQVGGYTMSSARYAQLFVHPDDMEVVSIEIRKALETTDPHYSRQLEHRIVYADGEIGYITVRFFIIKDNQGRTVKTYGANQDITERKRMEDELRRSETLYRTFFESTGVPTVILDADGTFYQVNAEGAKISGFTKEELEGKKSWTEFIAKKEDLGKMKEIHRLRREAPDKAPKHYEFLFKDRYGNLRNIYVTATLIPGTKRSVISFMDLTERKRAEEERDCMLKELEAKNRELERFTYTVSHDLRSPLVTIQGFTSMLQSDLERDNKEKAKTDLQYVANASTKMDRLLQDTLQLSRIGRIANPPEDVPFGAIVQDALEQTAEQIKSNGVEVSVAEDLPAVHVDRMRIAEVLVNLIGNSVRYRGDQPHPKIEIGYRLDGEETVFFVKDNGIGIDKTEHEKVFELFYRVDALGEGTGAGLAIVKRIIEVHGGRIWIESEKGKGCTVCFTLPVV